MENKHTQQVDFSNPNANKITSATTTIPMEKILNKLNTIKKMEEDEYDNWYPDNDIL